MNTENIHALFAKLEGIEIPGGCESCDAYQTVTVVEPGVTHPRTHHDSWCPEQRRRESRRP